MKIAITCRDFSSYDRRALHMLEQAGLEIADYSDRGYGIAASPAKIAEDVGDAELLLLGLEPCNEEVLQQCPRLKMVSRRGVGYDNVDLEACRRRGITVTRALGGVEGAVAEHVLAYILYFARRIDRQDVDMQQHVWNRILMPGAKNRTLGLIGFGGIGKEVAKRAVPFGMNVLYHCRHPKAEWDAEYGVTYRPLDALLQESDYVALCLPLTEETQSMCDKAFFAKMKPGSYLINIARGGIVSDEALKEAVLSGHLAGAAVDAFRKEPCTDSPLFGVPGIVLTPHTAHYTQENFGELNILAVQNILDYLNGCLKESVRLA